MAGIELEKYAIGHEMLNQGNATQTHRYLQLCSFTSLHNTIFT